MFEEQITWQHAIQFEDALRRKPELVARIGRMEVDPSSTILPMRADLPVRKMRDWIYQTVGNEYSLYGIFKEFDDRVPAALRFDFSDIETAVLFKLTWI